MLKRYLIVFSLLIFGFIKCSSTLPELATPTDNGCLIIGSLIFDINGYNENYTTLMENIEIAIVGRVSENGQIKNMGYWAVTDEDGYFSLANVPPGKYAIKGFRTHLIDSGELVVINELIDPQRNYFELYQQEHIPMTGNLFDTESSHRIINFKHNVFTLYPDKIIRHERFDRLIDFKVSAGEEISRLPTPIYFIEKYENSPWVKYLELQMMN